MNLKNKSQAKSALKISNTLWLGLVGFACIAGFAVGILSTLVYQQRMGGNSNVVSQNINQPEVGLPALGNVSAPTEDGIFLYNGGQLVKLTETLDGSQINFRSLASTNEAIPTFAIRGENYPLGMLKLKAYYAGIGVDLSYGQNGATINSVFPNSPAQNAGLQPGEVITGIDGTPVNKQPMLVYTPGKNDLFGLMKEKIVLQVLSGTSTRNVELAMSFRDTLVAGSYIYNENVKFTVEPKDRYILVHPDKKMQAGVYRFEFIDDTIYSPGIMIGPTPTPTLPPIPLPPQKWIFVVR